MFHSWLIALVFVVSGCASSAKVSTVSSAKPVAAEPGAFDPELRNYNYPFTVKFFEFESQRQQMHMAYLDVAPASANGRTVVLLHGKNFTSAYWEKTIRALNDQGFRVVAVDQIGFGKSTKPDSYQFSLHQLASNTNQLLKSLGITKASFVGHSMGGMLGVRYALMFPEAVEKLALVNPIGLEDWKLYAPYRSVSESFAQELKATPESVKGYQQQVYFAGEWKPEYDASIEIPLGWLKSPEYSRIAWNSALTTDMVFTQPVVYEFPKLKTKTLLIIGQRDTTAIGKAWATKENAAKMGNYRRLGREAQRAIPGSKLVAIEGAGHLPQVEKFDVYMKALSDFLK
jgi:pimeloyl-ACP methyl ester carboxylesterase